MSERIKVSGQLQTPAKSFENVALLIDVEDRDKTSWTTIGLAHMSHSVVVPSMPRRSVKRSEDQGNEECEYSLEHVLGEGGMGVVYAARQTNLDRSVALKRLRLNDPEGKLRAPFLAEATITGRLDHPNIVPIHDVGIDESGVPFYTMKRVTGQPWSKKNRTLPQQENLEILLRLEKMQEHQPAIKRREMSSHKKLPLK